MKCSAITGDIFGNHDCKGHKECHDRLVSILTRLPENLKTYTPTPASFEDLQRVHVPGYLTWLEKQCVKHVDFCMLDEYVYTGGYLENNQIVQGFLDPNTYINPCSYEVATYAAGSAIDAVNRSVDGECCFALVRPPGHHAEADRAMGFCLLNNAAVAAAHALTHVDRVAIIDWDAHHGNGTQNIFYDSNKVLYCSVHQKDTFPHTGFIEDTGRHEGEGFTINAPLVRNSGMADYFPVFTEIFIPALERFKPDLVIVSAGQDVLSDDPLECMNLVPSDIGTLTALVRDATERSLTFVLEGGYGLSHPESIRTIFDTLGKSTPAEKPTGSPHKTTTETITLLKKLHCLS
ncbi:MAG: histone deacetylase [Methanoregula sp.]|uniref:histone deacetylase family protein n=1 Tax=Methanoregula sp. TaxID=2052170 RepID=UPI0025ECE6C9|nr:histone deacetylase [Methanoregula sp.]MCK9632614.1 histone deacetylase [Methanoregula sp.]